MYGNIAVVGCGAIAQEYHLRAIAHRRDEFDNVWVIDPNAQARHKATAIVSAEESTTLADVRDDLQFVIIASPNKDHYSIAREAILRDAHVLIEKPFVIWPDEGRDLIRLSAERGRIIAVNQTRRFFPYAEELQRRIAGGEFGALRSIAHEEGGKLNWPFVSGASFSRGAQRTGVIMDIGVHVLDFYQYLLNPTWRFVSATHDGFCGPEGLAELRLRADDAPVSIRLSRYEKQRNISHLEFEKAQVEISIFDLNVYSVMDQSRGKTRRETARLPHMDPAFLSDRILNNFIGATTGREKCRCEATSSLPVIQILDEIYVHADRYSATLGTV